MSHAEYQNMLKDLEALTEQERQLERYKDHLRHEQATNDRELGAIKRERLALAEKLRTIRANLKINKVAVKKWVGENPGDAINKTMLGPQSAI